MRALWFAPPTVLLAGAALIAAQLRRIATQRQLLAETVRNVAAARATLVPLRQATERTRASLEGLERR